MIGENYKNFTIIIPTLDRHNYLKRLLYYYSDYHNIKIIIADSSKSPFNYLFTKNILYFHLKNASFLEKINQILPQITTEYTLLCADDTFTIPETISQIVTFLDKNKDYNSGQGANLCFFNYNCGLSFHYVGGNMRELNNDKPSCRLLHLYKDYFHLYYSVVRTETFKTFYHSVYRNGILPSNNLTILEIFKSSYFTISGKHIVFPTLYAIDEYIKNSAGSRLKRIPELIAQNEFKADFNNYYNFLGQYLSKKEKKDIKTSMRIIKKSLMVYLFHIRKKKVKRIAEIIFLNVKKYIKKALKKLFIVNYIKLCVKQKKSKNCDNNLYNKINNLPHGITGLEYFKKINSVIQEYRDDLPKLT